MRISPISSGAWRGRQAAGNGRIGRDGGAAPNPIAAAWRLDWPLTMYLQLHLHCICIYIGIDIGIRSSNAPGDWQGTQFTTDPSKRSSKICSKRSSKISSKRSPKPRLKHSAKQRSKQRSKLSRSKLWTPKQQWT